MSCQKAVVEFYSIKEKRCITKRVIYIFNICPYLYPPQDEKVDKEAGRKRNFQQTNDCGKMGYSEAEVNEVYRIGLLHDIGKI